MPLRAFWIVSLVVAVVLAEGCDSGNGALDTGGVQVLDPRIDRPAPASLRALPTEPIELESIWAWKDIWVSLADLGWCTLETFGFEKSRGAKADRQFTVDDLDNHFVLTFGLTAVPADQCAGFRVQLPNSEHAGFWWARASDLKGGSYPFSPQRFAVMAKVEPGLFEVDTATVGPQGNWSGKVRLIRIDPYGNPGETIELQKVEAKLNRAFGGAKAPPVKVRLEPGGAGKATALLTRATVSKAVADLGATASFWRNWPQYATDLGRLTLTELARKRGIELLKSQDPDLALRTFAIAAQGSGDPVGFLYRLRDELGENQRAALWPNECRLPLESFEYIQYKPFYPWRSSEGRSVEHNEVVTNLGVDGTASAYLSVSDPVHEGASWYTLSVGIPVTERPFGLRFWVRPASPSATTGLALAYLPELSRQMNLRMDLRLVEDDSGWHRVDLGQDIAAAAVEGARKMSGRDLSQVRISYIGLNVQGPANEFQLDRIEVYLPEEASEP